MQGHHMHMPGWMHLHKPNWHAMGVHFGHLVHDPRFWAAIALIILFGLMILASIMTKTSNMTPMPRTYPGYPYLP